MGSKLIAHLLLAVYTSAAPPKAFFVFFSSMLKDPEWPEAYEAYRGGVFIMDPFGATASAVTEVHEKLNATVLLYWDFQDIRSMMWAKGVHGVQALGERDPVHHQLVGCSGLDCCDHAKCSPRVPGTGAYKCGDDDYNRELRSVFNISWAIHRILDNGTRLPVCTDSSGVSYVPLAASVDPIVGFVSKKVRQFGMDGVYLDGRVASYSFSKNLPKVLNATGWKLDVNGDGVADSYDDMVTAYATWAPVVAAKLRVKLGPHATMVANTGGELSDPSLSGITTEIESCVAASTKCREGFLAQHEVSSASGRGERQLSVLWLTHSEKMPASEQCRHAAEWQAEMPWLVVGVDNYDGSFITCPED